MHCEDGGRDWSDAFTRQGTSKIAVIRSQERDTEQSLPLSPQKEPTLPTTLILDFEAPKP